MIKNLIYASLAINFFLFIWLIIVTLKARSFGNSFKSASKALGENKLPQMLDKNNRSIETMSKKIEDLFSLNGKLNKKIEDSYRNIGIVRFNAFNDTGGELSFSIALLDDFKNGIIITSINGREDSRTFIKEVSSGVGTPELSEEEEEAVNKAVENRR